MFSKEQFTTVTPLSKALAMVVFIILPFGAFFLGMSYGQQSVPPVETLVFPATDDVEEVDTLGWRTYESKELGFKFRYPAEWGDEFWEKGGFNPESGLFDLIPDIYWEENDFIISSAAAANSCSGSDSPPGAEWGYIFQDGVYFARGCDGGSDYPLTGDGAPEWGISHFKIINTVNTEAIMWVSDDNFGDCFYSDLDPECDWYLVYVHASINLPDGNFPGVDFSMQWQSHFRHVSYDAQGYEISKTLTENPTTLEEMMTEVETAIETIEIIE